MLPPTSCRISQILSVSYLPCRNAHDESDTARVKLMVHQKEGTRSRLNMALKLWLAGAAHFATRLVTSIWSSWPKSRVDTCCSEPDAVPHASFGRFGAKLAFGKRQYEGGHTGDESCIELWRHVMLSGSASCEPSMYTIGVEPSELASLRGIRSGAMYFHFVLSSEIAMADRLAEVVKYSRRQEVRLSGFASVRLRVAGSG